MNLAFSLFDFADTLQYVGVGFSTLTEWMQIDFLFLVAEK
jgi:hypothetical protein